MTMLAPSPADRRMARVAPGNGSEPQSVREIKYREDAANYVTAMLAELRQIAGKAGLDRLVASLDAAYYDAYGALDSRARTEAPAPRRPVAPPVPKKSSAPMEPNAT